MLKSRIVAVVLMCCACVGAGAQAVPPQEPVQHEFTIKNFKTESGVVLPDAKTLPHALYSGSGCE